ncbi:MAG: hypothetical protein ACFFD5_05035 [Candidatus Thorarchaeota archaeon]
MSLIPSISLIVGYIFILCLSSITIIYIIQNRNRYGTKLIGFFNAFTVFNSGIIFSTFFIFSVVFFVSMNINLLFWKLSIISTFISLNITSIIYSFFKQYRKFQIFPFIPYTLLFGLLIGVVIIPNAITIIINDATPLPLLIPDISLINYEFNLLAGIIIIIFQIILTLYFLYISTYVYVKSEKIEVSLPFFINSIIYLIPMIMYMLYIIIQETFFRELYIILIWITYLAMDIMLIKDPNLFFILPNKILSINIYHKSGVLLYNYNFESDSHLKDESATWGNVLIGLNHILNEFIDKEDKIDILQTKNAEIVVKYEIEYGYAIMVITNQKNDILEKLIEDFSSEFKKRYKNELIDIQDLNRIINLAEFTDTKDMIERNFQLYL